MRYVLFLLLLAEAAPAQPKLVETTEKVYWYNNGPNPGPPQLGFIRRERFAYDNAGRLAQQRLFCCDTLRPRVIRANTFVYGAGLGPVEQITENPVGSLAGRLDYGYQRTTFTYTPFDSVATSETEQYEGWRRRMRTLWRITHTYDNRQRQTQQVTAYLDTNGRETGRMLQRWQYEANGQRVIMSATACGYRNSGRDTVCEERDRSTFHYDVAGRLLSEVQFGWDDSLRALRDSTIIYTYRYDGASSRVVESLRRYRFRTGESFVQWRWRFQYDAAGRLSDSFFDSPGDTGSFLTRFHTVYRYGESSASLLDDVRVTAYPNPCQQTVYLRFNADTGFVREVDFYNLNGQLLKQFGLGDQNPIDVSDLPNGMYVVRVKGDRGTGVTKLIIQK